METVEIKVVENAKDVIKKVKNKFNLRHLRISLKYRPKIFRMVMKMRQCINKKNLLLHKLKRQLRDMSNIPDASKDDPNKKEEMNSNNTSLIKSKIPDKETTETINKKNLIDSSTQTEDILSIENKTLAINNIENNHISLESGDIKENSGWNMQEKEGDGKSIADQVKEVAQSALRQSGMVYVESAGMYYDYKTGYYYNSELGLYYHTDTNCYYYYSEDKQEFVFHSYPDRRSVPNNNALEAHERRKARKIKKARKDEEDIDILSKSLSQDKEDEATSPKRRKKTGRKIEKKEIVEEQITNDSYIQKNEDEKDDAEAVNKKEIVDLEDGECSETSNESEDEQMSDSTSTASDDDIVAKHHPPCMRIIVRDTKLPKLKVGTLFLITKDGGTVGREGDSHTILLRDHNVSRNHLDIRYDSDKRIYVATDLGSKNGTLLNGAQMSESQVVSNPMEVVHGSTIQLGETKLLCHIHSGNDTCGHCEPGLLIETKLLAQEKEKAAYTRTCSVQKQHQLELARLKNKYVPEPLMIEDGSYKDRAKERRDTVGSSHHSVKTQSTDVETFIAPENKGFKLLEKMGWSKGEGLGKDSQGDTEPIPLVSNDGKAGLGNPGAVGAPTARPLPRKLNKLGHGTMRLAAKSKLLQPPAKAFTEVDDDDE